MTKSTKNLLIGAAVIAGIILLWKKMNAAPATGTSTGGGIAVSTTASTSPANAGAQVPPDDSSGKNPSR